MILENERPAISRALGFIRHGLISGVWMDGQQLPSISLLARWAGVSPRSMWTAVNILKNEKVLTVIKGGRIFAGSGSIRAETLPSEGNRKWRTIKERIYRDILDGKYAYGEPLPSLKRLRFEYGVCFVTLKKALVELESERIIVRWKKTYQLTRPSVHTATAALGFIGISKEPGKVHFFNDRIAECADWLERECARSNINLQFIPFDFRDPRAIETICSRRDINLGYIFWLGDWFHFDEPRSIATDLIDALAKKNMPVAIFDEMGDAFFPPKTISSKHIRIFTIAAVLAGLEVGRVLLAQGHRAVAYVGSQFRHVWSKKRFEGLQRAFRNAAGAGRLRQFTRSEFFYPYDIVMACCDFSLEELEKIMAVQDQQEHLGLMVEHFRTIRESLPSLGALKEKMHPVKEKIAAMLRLLDRDLDPQAFAAIRDSILSQATNQGIAVYLGQIFEEALADPGISAWVVENDMAALVALDFLRLRRVNVPADISIVGFDNTREALSSGLTSYSFNIPFCARSMLSFLLGNPTHERCFRGNSAEIEGVLIERETTGPCRR